MANKLIEALGKDGWTIRDVDASSLSVVGGERVIGEDARGKDCFQSRVILSFIGQPG
jgi:hypothetical protein